MFISLSKTFAKVCGFRFGFGIRITKRNAPYMLFFMLFVWMFQIMWYMLVFSFWLMYAMCYGIYWCIKQLVRLIIRRSRKSK